MKKFICSAAMLLIIAMVMAQPKTIYLNSKTVTCTPMGVQKECLQYKINQSDTAWEIYSGDIDGFTYNPGYFYILQIEQIKDIRPQWKLIKVISKTKSMVQQLPGDSVVNIASPPASLVGQWGFSRLLTSTGTIKLNMEKEMLQFDAVNLKITGKATCNSFFGNYTTDSAHALKFEAIGHTMMACEGLETENKVMKAMELITNWSVTGNTLQLKAGDKTLIELKRMNVNKI